MVMIVCVNVLHFFGKHYSLSHLDFMSVKVDFSVYKTFRPLL